MTRNMSGMFSKLGMLVLAGAVPAIGCGGESLDAESEAKWAAMENVGVIEGAVTYREHDYLFVTTRKTWEAAQAHCQLAGDYSLVTINDESEEFFLGEQERSRGLYNWWIGANDKGVEGSWVWSYGSSSYTNWDPGEPNNSSGGEDCAVDRFQLGTTKSELWNDWPCGNEYPFICERDSVPTSNRGSFYYSKSNTSTATSNTADHTIQLYAGQVFTVGTCGVPGASGMHDTYLRINNPSGTEIASNNDAGGSCGQLSNISIVAPVAGSYTVRAGCNGNTSCEGTVAYNFL